MPQMTHPLWAVSMIKRGTAVLVNINYDNAHGIPERWAVGTLVGTAQRGRLSRIMFDDTGAHDFAGTTNIVASCRVKRANTGAAGPR